MDEDEKQNKHGETWQEAKSRYNRTYYRRHKERVIKAQKARERASRIAKEERAAKAAKARLEALERGRETNQQNAEEWRELGWIVAKMNLEAGMSQRQIFLMLQGLTTQKKIAEWCAKGRKRGKLKKRRKSNRG